MRVIHLRSNLTHLFYCYSKWHTSAERGWSNHGPCSIYCCEIYSFCHSISPICLEILGRCTNSQFRNRIRVLGEFRLPHASSWTSHFWCWTCILHFYVHCKNLMNHDINFPLNNCCYKFTINMVYLLIWMIW